MSDTSPAVNRGDDARVRLFLCGDLMTGRGIDQVLPHPGKPHLFEPWVRSANGYVELAERAAGPIGRGLDCAYPWGDALAVLEQLQPHARIVNLETAVTTSEDAQAGKFIHYRMNPDNLPCLTVAGIDCCVLANNHVLDWGRAGLAQTLAFLRGAGLRTAGAGLSALEAAAPAVIGLPINARVLVFAFASPTSGVPADWAAASSRSGINFLEELSARTAQGVAQAIALHRRPGDIVVVSLHWGGNWGFDIPREQQAFAHALIDAGGADIVHGHSSHHVKGIEVRRGKLILYGCGDFLNDYEGIGGHERFNGELGLMYFPSFDPAGALDRLALVPTRIRHLRVNRARGSDVEWLAAMLTREGEPFGTRVEREPDDTLLIHRP